MKETEERLYDAALTLFAEKGYEAASVREIIEAIGVTRPVLYYYCASKEDLFKRVVRWKHDAAYLHLVEALRVAGSCVERLRTLARGAFAFCAADPRAARLMFQTQFGPRLPGIGAFMDEIAGLRFQLVCGVMHEGLQTGQLRGGEAAGLALAFCCLIDQHLNVLARQPGAAQLLSAERADGLVDLFLHGAGSGRRVSFHLPGLGE
jgi:AcrR family transcriptional regulator